MVSLLLLLLLQWHDRCNLRRSQLGSEANLLDCFLVFVFNAHASADVGEESIAGLENVVVEPDSALTVTFRVIGATDDMSYTQGVGLEEQREQARQKD